MRAGDRDADATLHQLTQHLVVRPLRDTEPLGLLTFRVRVRDRRAVDQHVRVLRQELIRMTAMHSEAFVTEQLQRVTGRLQIGTGDRPAQSAEHLRQSLHPRPADADQMRDATLTSRPQTGQPHSRHRRKRWSTDHRLSSPRGGCQTQRRRLQAVSVLQSRHLHRRVSWVHRADRSGSPDSGEHEFCPAESCRLMADG